MPAINNECQSARYTRYVSTAIIVMIKVDEHHAYVGEFNMHPVQRDYAAVRDLKIYYEIHGTPITGNPPLILLHGGGDTIETSFGKLLPELARHRQVIAFEQRGFGHTADVPDRPFSFEESAQDTLALLDFLKIKEVDLLGFSNGGTIALHVARQPQRVKKLIAVSALFKRDGSYPWFWDSFASVKLGDMPQQLRDAYVAVAPHPENLQMFFDKCVERMRNFTDITDSAMREITAPTLVIVGDADVVRPEHGVEMFRLLPSAQLAVLPGTDHMQVTARTEWLVTMINSFLDAGRDQILKK